MQIFKITADMSDSVKQKMKQAFFKTTQVFKTVMPMLTGVLLLVSLLHQFFKNNYQHWFSGNLILDPFIGAIAGSISFGMPVTSYVVGGELLHAGVSLLAVTAFIMSWTTVGLIMIPLEASALGIRFAIIRNILNFIFALIVAISTVSTLKFLF
ncbi:MAG: hypothetical protein OES33_00065 [Desulfobulbaceae bacterium]|jgi:uncharacterized membrane protein YraQ (UPF0718 family)|nr:hypothetical protein [Desulfobulbaceae bacterium]